jgi:hypothetical protein
MEALNISEEEYRFCQKIWTDNGMESFKDFLEWYNNQDVGHFVMTVERLQIFYFHKGIDVFKTATSVPGIARQLLFKSAWEQQAEFSLIDKKNANLYATIKDNIVGKSCACACLFYFISFSNLKKDLVTHKAVAICIYRSLDHIYGNHQACNSRIRECKLC